ncbi:MAG TPA: GAF domain-containing protein [Pseudolabrys sp.]|nr:GAF domain-containing protein [Pseudolabrys sp.]
MDSLRDLSNGGLKAQLEEAHAQLAATSEVLQVISSSPGELEPVFNAILENVTRICGAKFANLFLYDNDSFRIAAQLNAPAAYAERWRKHPVFRVSDNPRNPLARLAVNPEIIHITDLTAEPGYIERDPRFVALVESAGARTHLNVPMLKDGKLVGSITVYRQEVQPFTDRQIALVRNFATQAVIAIENARLLSELRQRTGDLSESLEQQTATSEVLQVISSSPGELELVFESMLENAVRLCGAKFGNLWLREGDAFRISGMHGASSTYAAHLRREPLVHPVPGTALGSIAATKRAFHVADARAEPAYAKGTPLYSSTIKLARARTILGVPILKDNELVGAIVIYRQEVRPFTEKQIALVTNFAAQAVIAIENTRLLNKLRESLQQQTATADVLKVISGSAFNLKIVLEALIESATRLCGATRGHILQLSGEVLTLAAAHGAWPGFTEWLAAHPFRPGRGTVAGRAAADRRTVHVHDVLKEPGYEQLDLVKQQGYHTVLAVPMLREEALLGVIAILKTNVEPFTEKQIELVETFADQAVIAIENVRLLNELRESLQQQTATADVLKVISRSTFDLQPVLETLTQSAARLCDAEMAAIAREKDSAFYYATSYGFPADYLEFVKRIPHPVNRGSVIGRTMTEGRAVQIPDVLSDPEYAYRESQKKGGFRTMLGVPLLREGVPIGVLLLARSSVQPFTQKQIELVETFADQAVIAIENVRLFEAEQTRTQELSESLEQQTATSEVLRVISSSQGELQPVFDSLLDNATRLCAAKFGTMFLCEADGFRVVAQHKNTPPALADLRRQDPMVRARPGTAVRRSAQTKQVVQVPDIMAEKAYTERDPNRMALIELGGYRAILSVPMLKDNEVIGVINIYRQETGAFQDKQVELVKNFAAQAVIAIENARLLNEIRESLQQQTATADVLQVISRSTFDLQTVLGTLVESAAKLCDADKAYISQLQDGLYQFAANYGFSSELADYVKQNPMTPGRGTITGRVALEGKTVHVEDVLADPEFTGHGYQSRGNFRTCLGVPLIREGKTIGVFFLTRSLVRPFTEKQIALLRTFADQAVIAIENVRLFNETKEALERQTATAEILKVISGSPTDTQPVFEAIVKSGLNLFGDAAISVALPKDGEVHLAAFADADPSRADAWRRRFPFPLTHEYMHSAAILDRRIVDIPDANNVPADLKAGAEHFLKSGYRAITIIPMMRGEEAIGALSVVRMAPGPLSEKQHELLKTFAAQAVIAIENTRLLNELRQRTDDLSESLEQQTATSEVLKVIASSSGGLQQVFDTMLQNATRLCGASYGAMWLHDGDGFRNTALYGALPLEYVEKISGILVHPSPDGALTNVMRKRKPVHVPDLRESRAYLDRDTLPVAAVELAGVRTIVSVPMFKGDEVIGAITIYRKEVRPFTDKQIELVQNFAAQAVIAIENTRLLNELRESLEQQTATSEVLKVISSSPGELEPVFNAMLANATRICQATFGNLFLREGTVFRPVAIHNEKGYDEYLRPRVIDVRENPGVPLDRLTNTKQVVHITDLRSNEAYINENQFLVPLVDIVGARSFVAVPMLKEGELIGSINMYRQEVRPFTDKQIELVKNFAAQAVIAIENARLLNELRQRTDDLSESLEQQTALSEVLGVISSSPTNLTPVFDAILANATQLCEGNLAALWRYDGKLLTGVAHYNASPQFAEKYMGATLEPSREGPVRLAALERRTVHVPDMTTEPGFSPIVLQYEHARTVLAVPLLREGELVGVIAIWRREVRPFEDQQIALVRTFADQAVIAIENTRLLNELRERTDDLSESLEQQTATSEVLKVISSSSGELTPVFDAMLENAVRICGAKFGTLYLSEGDGFRTVAMHNVPPKFAAKRQREPFFRPAPGSPTAHIVRTRQFAHISDLTTTQGYIEGNNRALVDLAELGGARTIAGVPMLKDDELVGVIIIYRQEVKLFTEKQIELLTNFAAQAVIAIENARLLNELRERTDDLSESLEQQTATSEVLKVISSSTGELQPVFETMLENATRLCAAKFGNLYLCEGDAFRTIAMHNVPPAFAEARKREPVFRPGPGGMLYRVARSKTPVHIPDVFEEEGYIARQPMFVSAVELGGFRSMLAVPMLKDGSLVGVIVIYRQEVGNFTDKQIELVKNFAAQAVIAIENARLLNELRQRTDDLSEALEQQTATSEVLKVISSSQGELETVFQTLLANATRICEAAFGSMLQLEGDMFRRVALHNAPAAFAEFHARTPVVDPRKISDLKRVVETKQVIHVADTAAEHPDGPIAKYAGGRTLLIVPMLKDEELIGIIGIYRQEVRPFTEKQVELVQNFAAQAVIAIENTRLLNELRQSLQQQTATADVLKVISRSTFDLQTVLNTLLDSAVRLTDADQGAITRQIAGKFYRSVTYGHSPKFSETVREAPVELDRGSVAGRALVSGRTVHIPDVRADPEYTYTPGLDFDEFHTALGVPMLREGVPIGVIALSRKDVRPFTDKQIELAATFADQAAIAIENVRLFESVEARTRELSASLEDLRMAQDRLVQTEKLASLGQLTAGIAHEIKNPLNFVNNFSGVSGELVDELQDTLKGLAIDEETRAEIDEIAGTLRGNLDKIVQHGKRADSIVKNMLLHSRAGSGEHRPVDINAVVEESLNLAYHGARAEKQGFNITLERSFDPTAGEVDLFPQEITRVLLNLISNGFYAATNRKGQSGDNGYEPTLAATTKNLGDRVEIRIRDNGTGIPPEVKEKMFNPFFTTKPAGEGTGLGLSISHDIIVKQHAGAIEVDTRPGEFTEFRIILPRMAASLAKSGGRA